MADKRAGFILAVFIIISAALGTVYFGGALLLMDEISGFFEIYGHMEGSLSYFWLVGSKEDDDDIERDRYYYRTESELDYETIIAREGADEHMAPDDGGIGTDGTGAIAVGDAPGTTDDADFNASGASINYDKLNDFDYLLQHFYQVDNTTTITGSQLNAEKLLSYDMTIAQSNDAPQILIYHTHSQEGYADSAEGDASTSVVAVGEELADILRRDYGYNVMHHTGSYDAETRDRAYSLAGPALEAILNENPTIEVVIDLHRDGVREDTRLVTEIDGEQTAQIMFFNGLSRTTALGDIGYLYNPYIDENMAFSFQMQLQAVSRYPGLARRIYLKGYRYNMHYCPKTLLVEVGAQTNTVVEAMNAMRPLAELLDGVLSPGQ
jgi:stage II sporulation protein P